jgi:hypothetical protein
MISRGFKLKQSASPFLYNIPLNVLPNLQEGDRIKVEKKFQRNVLSFFLQVYVVYF